MPAVLVCQVRQLQMGSTVACSRSSRMEMANHAIERSSSEFLHQHTQLCRKALRSETSNFTLKHINCPGLYCLAACVSLSQSLSQNLRPLRFEACGLRICQSSQNETHAFGAMLACCRWQCREASAVALHQEFQSWGAATPRCYPSCRFGNQIHNGLHDLCSRQTPHVRLSFDLHRGRMFELLFQIIPPGCSIDLRRGWHLDLRISTVHWPVKW
mmetsp:Transcript_118757/g.209987  ORF Transcript_118757/g.209987 Transcript_118757/m.209987 type:complete len:214 (+) Transcript_118757:632-1273(+)